MLTSSRRKYALGLSLCLGALAMDKLVLRAGEPESASAGVAVAALAGQVASVESLLALAASPPADEATLAARLDAAAAGLRPGGAGASGAGARLLGVPQGWAVPVTEEARRADPSKLPVLGAVLKTGGESIAVIDGRPRRVGERIGTGVLVEVRDDAAVLQEGDRRHVLLLAK